MTAMLEPALALAAQGWAVFPCWPDGPKAKAPMTAHGFQDATRDPDTITAWWSRVPRALIGAALPESLIVLDLDPRHGGTLDVLEAVTGPLPATLTVWSGRGDGGCHLYFRRPHGNLTQTRLPDGVDLRIGGRHYLIMPTSPHPATGDPYVWETRPVEALPARAAEVLRKREPVVKPHTPTRTAGRDPGAGLVAFVEAAQVGERNDRLFWAACRAHERGDDTTVQALFDAAQGIGLTDTEAAATIASARRTIEGGIAS